MTTTAAKKTLPKPKQWAEAEALWALGEITRAEIAEKLNISTTAVSLHMKKRGVVRGSRAEEHRQKIADAATDAATEEASVHASKIRETKDEHYKMAQGLAKLAWSEIITAKQNKSPISTAASNLKALETAVNVIQKARIERWAVLGLDRPDAVDTNTLPDLVIEELTADQVEDLRTRQFNEFEDDIELSVQTTDETPQ